MITVHHGELHFEPGIPVLLKDTGCTPMPAQRHTVMHGRWQGTGDVLSLFAESGSGEELVQYVRVQH